MAEEEFLDIQFTRDELRNIIFPENPVTCRSCHKPRINKKLSVAHFSEEHRAKICTVGSYHPHIVHNNIQNNVQNNPQNIAPNNAQYEIHHVAHNIVPINPPNAQDYVTRNEFIQFKESINEQFARIEQMLKNGFKTINKRITRKKIKKDVDKKKMKKKKE